MVLIGKKRCGLYTSVHHRDGLFISRIIGGATRGIGCGRLTDDLDWQGEA